MEEKEKAEKVQIFEELKDTFITLCLANYKEILLKGSSAYYDETLAPLASLSGIDDKNANELLKKLFLAAFEAVVTNLNIETKHDSENE